MKLSAGPRCGGLPDTRASPALVGDFDGDGGSDLLVTGEETVTIFSAP